jgi:hypothetical protein
MIEEARTPQTASRLPRIVTDLTTNFVHWTTNRKA